MINSILSEKLGYDFQTLKSYVDNYQPVSELAWLSNEKDRRYICKLEDKEREKFDLGWYELKKARPELQITYPEFVDNKIMINKQPRKLFKYLNDKELSELVGKYKLPKKDLYLVVSTNFDDFLMCSTDNSWTSCTNLKDGDFRYTTVGNIFTKGRFIAYITDLSPKEFEGLQSYNMFFRCFGFINEDGQMVTNIWYPIKEYLAIDSCDVKSVKEVINKKSKYGFDFVFNKYDGFVYPYLDYSDFCSDSFFEFKDEYLRYDPKVIFKDGNSVDYTEYLKFDGELDFENALWRKCDICGSREDIKTYGDVRDAVNLCPACKQTYEYSCTCCGKQFTFDKLYFAEDNHYWCETCAQDKTLCSCGTTIHKKNEKQCRFCRSGREDAYFNHKFTYVVNGNLYDYTRHHYVEEDKLPPAIKYDEETFEDTEKYARR